MHKPKTALVTGGAKRVGRAIVERLAEAGFHVAFTYRHSAHEASGVVERLTARGHKVLATSADLAQPHAGTLLAEWASVELDGVDVLVNNASVYEPDDTAPGPSSAQIQRLMQVNYIAPAELTTALLPMLRTRAGVVINMLDLLATRPWPAYSAYCASKAALQNFTLSSARRLAPDARAVGIAPGVVDWPEEMPVEAREAYLRNVPLGRAGTPADVASLVHFLVTQGTYITGQIITLDGGRSLK